MHPKFTILITAAWLLSIPVLSHAASGSPRQRDRAVWAVIDYCASLKGEPSNCYIAQKVGGCDAWLLRKFKACGIVPVNASWISGKHLPADFEYMEIDDFVWTSKRTAHIRVYMSQPFGSDPGRIMETYGTLYLKRDGSRWYIEEQSGNLQNAG